MLWFLLRVLLVAVRGSDPTSHTRVVLLQLACRGICHIVVLERDHPVGRGAAWSLSTAVLLLVDLRRPHRALILVLLVLGWLFSILLHREEA